MLPLGTLSAAVGSVVSVDSRVLSQRLPLRLAGPTSTVPSWSSSSASVPADPRTFCPRLPARSSSQRLLSCAPITPTVSPLASITGALRSTKGPGARSLAAGSDFAAIGASRTSPILDPFRPSANHDRSATLAPSSAPWVAASTRPCGFATPIHANSGRSLLQVLENLAQRRRFSSPSSVASIAAKVPHRLQSKLEIEVQFGGDTVGRSVQLPAALVEQVGAHDVAHPHAGNQHQTDR